MLVDLLRVVTPEMLVNAIKSNPTVVQTALLKLDAYIAFGKALTTEQQICISSNLGLITDYFNTEAGKDSISLLAEEFVKFVKTK